MPLPIWERPGLQSATGYFERTYEDLSPHSIIYFGFKMIAGGSWQQSDSFSVQFDNNNPQTFLLSTAVNAYPSCDCSTIQTLSTSFIGRVFHVASTLTLRIGWKFTGSGSPLPFVGIKDLRMSFGTKKLDDVEDMYLTLGNPAIQYSTGCAEKKYYDKSTSSCLGCNSKCSSCFGPTDAQCYIYEWGNSYTGTVVANCPSYCNLCLIGASSKCFLCWGGSHYLDIDSTCKASCTTPATPFTTGARTKCIRPCATGQYMLWNEACVSSCDAPLVKNIDPLGNTCFYSCGESANIFLYWNGSCLATCPYYQRIEGNYRFCDACQPNYYMHDDESCQETCVYNKKYIGGSNFCHFPCRQDQYLYPDSSCQSTCSVSFIQKSTEKNYYNCAINLSQSDLAEIKKLDKVQGDFDTMRNIASKVIIFINFANPSCVFLNIMIIMPTYLRYLSIRYPTKLQYLLDMSDQLSITIIPDMPSKAVKAFPQIDLPGRFGYYQEASSFTVNFWDAIITISIVAFILLISFLLSLYAWKRKIIGVICNKAVQALKWNFCLATFIPFYQDIVLSSSFEFRAAPSFLNNWQYFSFAECILINILSIFIFAKIVSAIFLIKKDLRISSNSSTQTQQQQFNGLAEWKDYKILYEAYKDTSLTHLMFVPLMIIRTYIFYATIAYFYFSPLAQMCLITSLSAFMLLFIVFVRPQRHKVEVAEAVILEVTLLVINISALLLAIFDTADVEVNDARSTIGDIIIWTSVGFSIGGCLYVVLKSIVQVAIVIKTYLSKRKSGQKVTPQTKERLEPSMIRGYASRKCNRSGLFIENYKR